MVKAIPKEFHSVTPIFMFKDARRAIEFYKKAFGALELFVLPGPDDKGVMHAEVRIGNSVIMMGEETPHHPCKSAETLGGSPVSFYIYIEDVDAAFRVAVDAGAKIRMPLQDMFWGDRAGTVQDPFGYSWTLATHIKDLTPKEIRQGALAAGCQQASADA